MVLLQTLYTRQPLKEYRMVKGHPEYIVSCDGEVYCLNYYKKGKVKRLHELKNKDGYICVNIRSSKTPIHRIVAQSFLYNPEHKPCVDHINTKRDDNRVENLRWVTWSENANNPLSLKHLSESVSGEKNGMYGKTHSEEYKNKLRKVMRGEGNPMYGKNSEDFMTPEAIAAKRKKYSESMKGKNKGRRMLNNGITNVFVKEVDVEYYLNNGFTFGMLRNKDKSKTP